MAAMKSVWSGAIPLGGMFTLLVEVVKATDRYEGDEALKQVCKCHLKPFVREDKCAEGGGRRMVARGKSVVGTVEMVLAVESTSLPGTYVEVSADQLKLIEQEINSSDIEPLAMPSISDISIEATSDLWYLRPNRKTERSEEAVSAFYAYLLAKDKALVARWSQRGRQRVVAIYPAKGLLCMTRLRYAQEVRSPDEELLKPGKATVPARAVEIIDQIIPYRRTSVLTYWRTGACPLQAAIRAALSGEPATASGDTSKPSSPVPDLMAALEAAAEVASGSNAKPAKKKAPAKPRAKAGAR